MVGRVQLKVTHVQFYGPESADRGSAAGGESGAEPSGGKPFVHFHTKDGPKHLRDSTLEHVNLPVWQRQSEGEIADSLFRQAGS